MTQTVTPRFCIHHLDHLSHPTLLWKGYSARCCWADHDMASTCRLVPLMVYGDFQRIYIAPLNHLRRDDHSLTRESVLYLCHRHSPVTMPNMDLRWKFLHLSHPAQCHYEQIPIQSCSRYITLRLRRYNHLY